MLGESVSIFKQGLTLLMGLSPNSSLKNKAGYIMVLCDQDAEQSGDSSW